MREIKQIIIHCSDSDYEWHDNIDTIRRWHIARGFKDIGYHYVILNDGTVVEGRSLSEPGAHCEGQNADSIGICLTGKKVFSRNQIAAYADLVQRLQEIYGLRNKHVKPHKYYNPYKTCPNFDVQTCLLNENE